MLLAFACLALLIGVGKPAVAATTGYALTFSASNFAPSPPPVGSVLGQFAFSLDPAHDSTGSVVANFLNLPHGTLGYDYTAFNGHLVIGGTLDSVNGVGSGTDDFFLIVSHFNSAPTFVDFVYAVANDSHIYSSVNGSVQVAAAPAPIPGALPLFVSAIGGFGLLGWRRRYAAA